MNKGASPLDFRFWSLHGSDDLVRLFNYPLAQIADVYGGDYNVMKVFENVWNRESLFIHASFVTYTRGGYLGRDGEFYDTLTKVYPDDGQNFFSLWMSTDGYHITEVPYYDFIVELTFIIDSDDYMGM
jgi:hypothetical protein